MEMLQDYHSFKFQPRIKTLRGIAMKKLLVAAAAVVAMSLPAVAADMPTKGPAAPVVPAPTIGPAFTLASALAGAGALKI
jgi:hypothetical protein